MITTTLDPITLKDVTDLDNAPYLIEGEGENALRIYFESEQNRREYLNTPTHGSDGGSNALNHEQLRNADTQDRAILRRGNTCG